MERSVENRHAAIAVADRRLWLGFKAFAAGTAIFFIGFIPSPEGQEPIGNGQATHAEQNPGSTDDSDHEPWQIGLEIGGGAIALTGAALMMRASSQRTKIDAQIAKETAATA